MPHLRELRDTLTWIGVTLMPLGLVITGGRAFLAPTADGDSASDVLRPRDFRRRRAAGSMTGRGAWSPSSRGCSPTSLLGLPWVADGVERMLETLVIGGATGAAVAAEFVVPLMVMVAGAVLLGLLLLRVGLEVATALLYVLGGLVLGLSVTSFGRRLLTAWLIAAAAIVMLPLLWSIVFAVGAALMLDAGATGGRGGFASFVAQLYNVAAALAVFWIAIKLALGVFHKASGAITGITATSGGGAGRRRPGGARARANGRAGAERHARRAGALLAQPARRPRRRRGLPAPSPRADRAGRLATRCGARCRPRGRRPARSRKRSAPAARAPRPPGSAPRDWYQARAPRRTLQRARRRRPAHAPSGNGDGAAAARSGRARERRVGAPTRTRAVARSGAARRCRRRSRLARTPQPAATAAPGRPPGPASEASAALARPARAAARSAAVRAARRGCRAARAATARAGRRSRRRRRMAALRGRCGCGAGDLRAASERTASERGTERRAAPRVPDAERARAAAGLVGFGLVDGAARRRAPGTGGCWCRRCRGARTSRWR